jgi:hypothetical protein|tara:strand:- start:804 stop:1043 length:240 start_codon:yes stop_codon:yes gene_type:complete
MKFTEIDEGISVFPGEYIYHEPSKAIVLAGAFNREEDYIRVLKHGRYLEDKISNFKKIKLSDQEKKERMVKKCGGCKGV